MPKQGAGSGGGSPPSAEKPLPNGDDWGDARSEGEPEVRNALVPGPPAYHGDRVFYRVVVCALAIVAVGALLARLRLRPTRHVI